MLKGRTFQGVQFPSHGTKCQGYGPWPSQIRCNPSALKANGSQRRNATQVPADRGINNVYALTGGLC